MYAGRKLRFWPLVLLISCCLRACLFGVIVEVREYHGKQVTCVHSGLMGVAKPCGTERYARVFTGVVKSSVEVGDTDKRLEIVPDEVFAGDSSYAIATTNQACLHNDIQAGEKWLFYLYRYPKSDELVLGFDSPSKPMSEAGDDISMLRDLEHLNNTGILIGTIERLEVNESAPPAPPERNIKVIAPLANYKVLAKSVKNGTEYTAYTNEKGYFKFELPTGSYDVTIAAEYGLRRVEDFRSMEGSVPVQNGGCIEHNFGVTPDTAPVVQYGTLSGHVSSPDGRTITVHPWVQLLSADSESFTSAYVDANGYFEAKKVRPGRYLVGVGIRAGTGGPEIPILCTTPERVPKSKRPSLNFARTKNERMSIFSCQSMMF